MRGRSGRGACFLFAAFPGADAVSMDVNVTSRPAYSLAYVKLVSGESVFCEPGSMVAISAGIEVSATMHGGVVRSTLRRLVAQEGFLLVKYTARTTGAWVALAPKFPGDVTPIAISAGDGLIIQSSSFLASSDNVDVSPALGSVQSFALREGATVMHVTGVGTVVIAAYGGVERFDLGPKQQLVVDSGHLVAWSAGLGFRVGPLKGIVSSTLTGEGLVGEFTGPGVVYLQTRAEQHLRSWLFPEHGQDSKR